MAEPNRYQKAARAVMSSEKAKTKRAEPPAGSTAGPDRHVKGPPATVALEKRAPAPPVEGPKEATYFDQKDEFGFDFKGPREAHDPVVIEQLERDNFFDHLMKSKVYDRDIARDVANAVDFKRIKPGLVSQEEKDKYLEALIADIISRHPRG